MINKDALMAELKVQKSNSDKLLSYQEKLIEIMDIDSQLLAYEPNLIHFYFGEIDYKIDTYEQLANLWGHHNQFSVLAVARKSVIKPFCLLSMPEGKKEEHYQINHVYIDVLKIGVVDDKRDEPGRPTQAVLSVTWFCDYDGQFVKINAHINKSFLTPKLANPYSMMITTPDDKLNIVFKSSEGEHCLKFIEGLLKDETGE